MIPVTPAQPTDWSRHASNIYSQFGEDGILAEIFRRIGETNKHCFEVGAADGKWFSNVRNLIDRGWKAALIEADESNIKELAKLDGVNGSVVVHGRAEPSGENSLDSILARCQLDSEPDLGVIDVDGQDYYLWNGMLKFRPRVMVIEYDPYADPAFVPDRDGAGQAGLSAIVAVSVSKGYTNVATTHTNAIFVANHLRDKFYEKPGAFEDTNGNGKLHPKLAEAKQKLIPVARPNRVENLIPWDGKEENVAELKQQLEAGNAPVLATGKEQEIKIAAILSRPRFGLNSFWDCASAGLTPWHIPIQSFYGVFWGQCMQTAMEDNLANGVDWFLTLDYDTMFAAPHVQLLIDALGQNPKVDAVAGLQARRGRPLPLAVRADGQMTLTGGLVQVTTAHFGLTLLRAASVAKMKKPWFWSTPDATGSWREGRLDDDIYFWGGFRDAGNVLAVHTGCRIGHCEEMVSQYDEAGNVSHSYISEWKRKNGFDIKSFE